MSECEERCIQDLNLDRCHWVIMPCSSSYMLYRANASVVLQSYSYCITQYCLILARVRARNLEASLGLKVRV